MAQPHMARLFLFIFIKSKGTVAWRLEMIRALTSSAQFPIQRHRYLRILLELNNLLCQINGIYYFSMI
jgi:hypothetical protein